MHLLRLASLVIALLASMPFPLGAQQFPAQQRGLSADTAYQSGELDSVNLFNGNLSLSLPLGQPYPVGPSFSLGLALHEGTTANWEFQYTTATIPRHRYTLVTDASK